MIGRTLAHYRITAAIGAGGMGQVYRATDSRLGREVALKVLPEELAGNPEMIERFRREARAVAALNHPNIVTLYSVEEADGVHFLTMELVKGESLDRLIPAEGLDTARILDVASGLAGALTAAHDRGIIHRDLKPANVMMTDDGSVKVLDFGLAKFQETESSLVNPDAPTAAMTSAGVVMGTRPYMSPEQVQGRALDHRTDIFSLGVLLYEVSTGKRPFHGTSNADLFASILRDPVPPLTDTRSDLPADLSRVVRRCLEKDPRHRIQTARDVGNELRDAARPISRGPAPDIVSSAKPLSPSGGTANDGFWVMVLPFKSGGGDLQALAEGLSEEVVTGLSRFSYLRVISRGATARLASGATDVRLVAKEIGARYVMEGSLRQAGSRVRVAVQLTDAATGTHLWAETYDRPFAPEDLFALQDDLVPRIVSTCADHFGVLARAISEAVRSRPAAEITPYEALMRGFGYHFRLSPTEHAEARDVLERAVERAPDNADCWAMLSWVYSHEHAHGFNPRPGSLDRALAAARRAVDLVPTNHLAQQALGVALFFRKERAACLSAAEQAIALNPLDGSNEAFFLITFSGDWERGCALIRRAMDRNPHHPGWYRLILSINEYRKGSYREAAEEIVRANLPEGVWKGMTLAAIHARLRDMEGARRALRDLLAHEPDFARSAQVLLDKWFEPKLVADLMAGLREAGLEESNPPRGN